MQCRQWTLTLLLMQAAIMVAGFGVSRSLRRQLKTECFAEPRQAETVSKALATSPNLFLQREMLNHGRLTKEEELELGRKVLRANQIRAVLQAKHDETTSSGHSDDEPLALSQQDLRACNVTSQEELQVLLHEGSLARDELVSSNIRLVVNIAQRWAKRDVDIQNAMSNFYSSQWKPPSIDEATQEGILGLMEAADRYDPKRGLRFSTYATVWITNYIRRCFQNKPGMLRAPASYFNILYNYRKALKGRETEAVPSLEELADTIGVSVYRLKMALRTTRPFLSLDQPISSGQGRPGGSGIVVDGGFTLAHYMESTEPLPEELVERSFLRQCLENAMATELSPHERDVLRLRLGLDDGVTRTPREVSEVFGGAMSLTEVRSTEQRAYSKLRSPFARHTPQLMAYLDFAGIDSNAPTMLRR